MLKAGSPYGFDIVVIDGGNRSLLKARHELPGNVLLWRAFARVQIEAGNERSLVNPPIKTIVGTGLVPKQNEEQLHAIEKALLGSLRCGTTMLEHGARATLRDAPEHYAVYALHITASNILFLIHCHLAT